MARQNLGKVSMILKGEYNASTTYDKLDVITYNGSSYACLKESVGNLPTNAEYWQLIAARGENGEAGRNGVDGTNGIDGEDGYTPVRGTDYWTQSDINTIQGYIDNVTSNKQDVLTAGNNITIQNNVISATGGGEVVEYTNNPGQGIYGVSIFSSSNKTNFIKAFNHYLKTSNFNLDLWGFYNQGNTFFNKAFPLKVEIQEYNSDYVYVRITIGRLQFNTNAGSTSYGISYKKTLGTGSANFYISKEEYENQNVTEIYKNPNGTVATSLSTNSISQDEIILYALGNTPDLGLGRGNTTAFTPTGDYNPSTKLYTDKTHYENMSGYDATKTQVLKNVNGVLTWVDE